MTDWQTRALAAEARIKELEGEATAQARIAAFQKERAEIAESQLSALQDSVRLKDEALGPWSEIAEAYEGEVKVVGGWTRKVADDETVTLTTTVGVLRQCRRASQALGGGDG